MKLLVLSINYWPEPTGFAPHTAAVAEHMVKAGHDVTVLTGFPFAPQWSRWPEYRGDFVRREVVNGVRLLRVTHFIPRQPGSAWQRMAMEASFCASGAATLWRGLFDRRARPDVLLYVGAQPAIAWLARAMSAIWRVPYIVKITDLAAQAAVDVGVVNSRTLASALERTEFSAYRGAEAAIVLCEPFEAALRNHGFRNETILIRDSVDLQAIRPGDGSRFRDRHDIRREEFVLLYSGSLGRKQGLESVVQAAELLAGDRDIRWVIVGEGEMRDVIATQIKTAGLGDRVLMLPLQPEAELAEMLAAADLLLLSQLRSVKDTVIPSKLLMYMAAGRPILAAVNSGSQAAAIVREAGCGLVVEPEDPDALADAVRNARAESPARESWARCGRAYAEKHFDRDANVAAQQRVIERVVSRGLREGLPALGR